METLHQTYCRLQFMLQKSTDLLNKSKVQMLEIKHYRTNIFFDVSAPTVLHLIFMQCLVLVVHIEIFTISKRYANIVMTVAFSLLMS